MYYIRFFIFIFSFSIVILEIHRDIYKVIIIYHNLIQSLHHSPLSPSPQSWKSLAVLIFIFTNMYTQYLHHIHTPTPSPLIFPLPLVQLPYTGPVLPSSIIIKKKKDIFLYLSSYTGRELYTVFGAEKQVSTCLKKSIT
jgi:hypothetical protein